MEGNRRKQTGQRKGSAAPTKASATPTDLSQIATSGLGLTFPSWISHWMQATSERCDFGQDSFIQSWQSPERAVSWGWSLEAYPATGESVLPSWSVGWAVQRSIHHILQPRFYQQWEMLISISLTPSSQLVYYVDGKSGKEFIGLLNSLNLIKICESVLYILGGSCLLSHSFESLLHC